MFDHRLAVRRISGLMFAGALALAEPLPAQFTVTPRATRQPDIPTEVLEVETPFYRIEFNLQETGSASSLIFKPLDLNLRAENYYANHNNMFRDWVRMADPDPITGFTRAIGGSETKDSSRLPATYRVVRQNQEELVLEFEVRYPPSDSLPWADKIINRRRLHLRADTPKITAENTIANTDSKPASVVFDLYEGLSLGRVATAASLPTPEGKMTGLDLAEESGSRAIFAPEVAGAWLGGLNQNGVGAAFSMDWADVDAMEIALWKTVGSSYVVTMRRRDIPAGGAITFHYTFMPFTGLGALDGMQGDLAGGMRVGEKPVFPDDVAKAELAPGATVPVRLFLASGTNRTVGIALQCVRQENAQTVLNATLAAELKTAETTVMTNLLTFPTNGLYVLTATVTNSGGTILRMQKGLEVGKTKMPFSAARPSGEQRGRRDAGEMVGPGRMDAQFTTIDPAFVTPHLPLAKNHIAGPARAFFLMPADSTLGHAREIAQRSDVEYEYFALGKIQVPPDTYNFRDIASFRKQFRASDAEVLVSIGIDWHTGLPPEMIAELLERVAQGGGLVLLAKNLKEQPELAEALAGATAITNAPLNVCAVPLPDTRYYELGKGRIALILCGWGNYRNVGEAFLGQWTSLAADGKETPIREIQWRGFEYSYVRLGELIRWAARHEGKVQATKGALAGGNAVVTIHNAGEPVKGTLSVKARSRRWDLRAAGQSAVNLPAGESVQTIPLKSAPDAVGWLALEIAVNDDQGKLLAFASAGAGAEPPATISFEAPSIFRPAEKAGTLGIDVAGGVSGGQLRVEVTDRFGRLVLNEVREVALADGKGRAEIDLAAIQPLSIYHDVRATFQAGGRVAAEATADLFLIAAKPDYAERFVLGVADAPERSALHLQGILPATRSVGLTLHTHSQSEAALYASGGTAAGGPGFSAKNRYAQRGEKAQLDGPKRIMTPPLLPSAAAVEAAKTNWQANARKAYLKGYRFCMLDDERRMSEDFDYNPKTLAGFREWLQKRYPAVADLNAAWGTKFADFSEVVPVPRVDLGDSKNLAPWLEFRMFIGDVIGEYYMQRPAEWAAEISPAMAVGEAGIYEPNANWPVDWSRYARYYRYTQRYGDTQGVLEELFRCFGEGARHGQWQGYGMLKISPDRRIQPWLSLLNGGTFCWFWAMVDNGYWNYGVCTSDQRPTAGYADLARDEFPDLTGGADRLIIASEFTDDGIALAYSYPSWVADASALGTRSKVIVEELGFQHRLVNLADLASGGLEKGGIRVLIVHEASCISGDQVKALRAFVENGGTLMCVGRVGWRDLNGRPYGGTGAMEVLTGVAIEQAQPLGRELAAKGADAPLTLNVQSSGVKLAAGVEVIDSADLDGQALPVLTRRAEGKGRVYWLNSALAGHRAISKGGVAEERSMALSGQQAIRQSYWKIFDQIIREAGIGPRCRLFQGDQPLFDTETWYYRTPSGRSLIVAHYLARSETGLVTVRFAQKGHVYDLRAHKYLGQTDSIQENFPQGQMRLFMILDYKVAGLDATLAPAAGKPGTTLVGTLTIRSAGAPPDLHALRVTVTGPQGEDLPAYRQTVLARDGKAGIALPLALNAPPGRYRMKAMDVASGECAEAPFEVGP